MNSDSELVRAYHYIEKKQELYLRFPRGCYKYIGVPKHVFNDFIVNPSLGRAYNSMIKGKYDADKIISEEMDEVCQQFT